MLFYQLQKQDRLDLSHKICRLTGMKKARFLYISASLYETAKLVIIHISNNGILASNLPFSWYAASPLLIFPLFFCFFLSYNPSKYTNYILPYIITKIMAILSPFFFVYHIAISQSSVLMQENFRFLQQFIFFILFFFVIDAILLISFIVINNKINMRNKWMD